MWNSQAPLQLLLSMPSTLSKENLINLQSVIDVDKIINSEKLQRDLCGEYAPFCDFCDKNLQYPCAHAYVKMKQAEGLDVEIDKTVLEETAAAEEPKEEKNGKLIRIAYLKRTR